MINQHVIGTHPDLYDAVAVRLNRNSFPVLLDAYQREQHLPAPNDPTGENVHAPIHPDSEPGSIIHAILEAVVAHHVDAPDRQRPALAVLRNRDTTTAETCVLHDGHYPYKWLLTVGRAEGHYRMQLR